MDMYTESLHLFRDFYAQNHHNGNRKPNCYIVRLHSVQYIHASITVNVLENDR